ncbi:unnamed protein product, partial [Phaeothamnion confervicola]
MKVRSQEAESRAPNPFDDASWWNRWSFSFVGPLLRLGASRALQAEDLYPLSSHDDVATVVANVSDAWHATVKAGRPSLWRAAFVTFRTDAAVAAFYTILESVCKISQPVVLRELLSWMGGESASGHNAEWYGWAMALTLGGLGMVQTGIHHVLFYYTIRAGWNLKNATMGLIH